MIIKLFRFSKRENSTKRPDLSAGTDFDCVLKENTSVESPAVRIAFTNKTLFDFDFNYAYIPEFKRYYFISDMVSDGFAWFVYMNSDVLASFKDTIGSSTIYVLRASAEYDGAIIDDFYPLKTAYTSQAVQRLLPWNNYGNDVEWPSVTNGKFIIGAVASSGTSGRYGSVNYYELDRTNLAALCNALLSDTIMSGFSTQDASLELQKAIIDPLSFIKSCIWLPFAYDPAVQTQGLPIWKWIADCEYAPMTANPPFKMDVVGFEIPKHPLTNTRGVYLNTEPFTRLTLSLPPFGIIQLDTSKTFNTASISCVFCTDLITGNCICDITTQEGLFLGRYSAQVGVQIQLSQVMRDYLGSTVQMTSALTNAVTAGATGNIAGAVASTVSAVGSVANVMRPLESSRGSNGGFSDLRGKGILQATFYQPANEDQAHLGRPLCAERTPASLGGYILAREGDIQIQGYATEQAAIKSYLEGGFYYE